MPENLASLGKQAVLIY